MTTLKRWAWAAAVGAAVSGSAVAQTTTTTTTPTTQTTTTSGSSTTRTNAGSTNQGAGGIQEIVMETPTITSTTASGGVSGNNVLNASNAFATYYNNPLYQGRAGANTGSLTTITAPGGFGAALYGTAGVGSAAGAGGVGGAAGTAANRTATGGARATTSSTLGGATGGLGGRTTAGGLGGTTGFGTAGGFGATGRTAGGFAGTQQNTQNQQLSTGRAVAYTQTIRFAAPPTPPAQFNADLQSMVASSSTLSSVPGLQLTAGDGGAVVIRGTVADDDERRVIEGMIRLSPGVKSVRNELTVR